MSFCRFLTYSPNCLATGLVSWAGVVRVLEAPEFPPVGLVRLSPAAIITLGGWLFLLLLLDVTGGRGMMLAMICERGTYPGIFKLAARNGLGIGGRLRAPCVTGLARAPLAPLPPICVSLYLMPSCPCASC
jgi:hypothetical protein